MFRDARVALAEAYYRQGSFQEAIQCNTSVLHEAPPTVPVLRGLGKALARLERYEEAYNHLRAAYDQESPNHPFTTGYLALCGAKGKPTEPGAKIQNVTWALSLLAPFDLGGDR
ncbi:MAG: hypothetical protein E6K70_15870, partial [Planctomycetota bacterium]